MWDSSEIGTASYLTPAECFQVPGPLRLASDASLGGANAWTVLGQMCTLNWNSVWVVTDDKYRQVCRFINSHVAFYQHLKCDWLN